ncbi:MAG: nicotinate-nucleotide--dimethylbenzimidazole phosphoribosyltransferase [Kiritimatiellaeota bacterium]|nr:nicotinate-nucleotide--dimethylbenzimidazole phosphoribosyltransferase [Kiritimatiellota bacterium]
MNLNEIIAKIKPADADVARLARERLDSLTKPQGSLGALEDCAAKFAAARGDVFARIVKPVVLTFAGDHGVAEEGVSAFPQEVTPQMVANFANGGAAINALAKLAGAELKVIDMGVAADLAPFPGRKTDRVIDRKIAFGTANIAKGPAMSREQVTEALSAGAEIALEAVGNGSTIICTGDMGIANTTPSAALYSAFLGIEPKEAIGRGTGVDDEGLVRKEKAVAAALNANRSTIDSGDPLAILAALGGFEIAGICGAILGAASERVAVVIDGFISGAAAVAAFKIKPETMDYCFFSHLSAEAGHKAAMKALGAKPLLDLGLRLGEGTGAVLALNLIEAALAVMNEMATFAEAEVASG